MAGEVVTVNLKFYIRYIFIVFTAEFFKFKLYVRFTNGVLKKFY